MGALHEAKVGNAVGELVIVPVVTSRVCRARVPQGQQVGVLDANRVAGCPSGPRLQQRPVAVTVGITRNGVVREHLDARTLAGGSVAIRVPEAAAADAQPCTRRSMPAARHKQASRFAGATSSTPRGRVLPIARCKGTA